VELKFVHEEIAPVVVGPVLELCEENLEAEYAPIIESISVAFHRQRTVSMLLHPERYRSPYPDFILRAVYCWVDLLDDTERIVYYHHLRKHPVAVTARVTRLDEQGVQWTLMKAVQKGYCVIEKELLSGFNTATAYNFFIEMSNSSDSIESLCLKHKEDYCTMKILKEYCVLLQK
jgi:hypothetical protein